MYFITHISFSLFYSFFILSVKSKLYFKSQSDQNDTSFLYISVESNLTFGDVYDFNDTIYDSNSTYDFSHSFGPNFTFWEVCLATFIKRHDYVSVVSIDNEFLNPKEIYVQFGPAEWHSTVKTFSVSNAVIVIVRTSGELDKLFYIKSSLWNQESIFVLAIIECSEDIKIEMTTLWQFYRIYKYVLVCGKVSPLLYIYRPFLPKEASRITEVTDLTEIAHNILHAVDNLYGAEMRIVFFPRMPTAVAEKGKYVGGVDYFALVTLRDVMNFTSVIFRPSDGHTFTQAGKKVSGSLRDIVIGNADIAFNGHFLQDYKVHEILLTRHMYLDKMCFIVSMPSFKSHYTIIMHIFSPTVWALIVVMYFMAVILFYGVQEVSRTQKYKYKIEDLFFLFYGLIILGVSIVRADITSKKFVLGSVLIMVLILNNTFQGSLVTVLSKPIRNPFIDTLDNVIESDLALQSQRAESLLSDPEIIQLLNVLRSRKVTGQNFIRLGRFPIMKLQSYRNYLNYKRNLTEHLHTVPECIMSNFLTYVVPRNSPFLDRINVYLLRFQETGLNAKWFGVEMDYLLRNTYWPLENEKMTSQTQAKIFSMTDLAFVFTLLLCGLTLSTVIFFVENIIGFKNKVTKVRF